MVKKKKVKTTPKKVLLGVIKVILWLIPVVVISSLLTTIITGGVYSSKHWADFTVVTLAVLIPFLPFILSSWKDTLYSLPKPKKPIVQEKIRVHQQPAPQIVTHNQSSVNTGSDAFSSIGYWILVIAGVIVVFLVIKGFLDWWFGLFGLGIGLILLILIFG